jgi:phytoene desaturase
LERSFRSWRDLYNPKTLWNALRLRTLNTAQNAIEKYLKDEKMQNMVSFQTLYIGVSPYSGPSIYTIIPMIQTMYGVHYSKGGMYSYVKAVEKRFKELGGKIKLNAKVEEVLFEGKKARGIHLDGQDIQSDAVVVNADFPRAMKTLIKSPKIRGKYTDKKIASMKYSCSVMILYLGLDKKVPDLRVHNLYFGGDFKQNLDEIFTGKLPEDPAYYIYSPSQIDDTVAPEGHENIYVLVPVPELKTAQFEWTDEVKHAFKEKIFQKMMKEKGLEDLKDHIVFEDMYTPDKFSSELEAHYGATFGLAPTLFQSIYFRPRNVHPYGKNLYFAGSSVHPGAGIPIAMTSGKLVHHEVKKDLPL